MTSANSNDFVCDICDKRFTNKYVLQKHKTIHDENRSKSKCDICSTEVYELEAHLRTHDEERKKYKCDICNNDFVTQTTLERHKITHNEY